MNLDAHNTDVLPDFSIVLVSEMLIAVDALFNVQFEVFDGLGASPTLKEEPWSNFTWEI